MVALSALDLSFVTSGSPASAALRRTLDLAGHLDGLGYRRLWLAEHHNIPSVASPAPEIMIGLIAAATRNIRVGSGGIMLPNHAPLMVAERFRMLEGLFPGRIDLGLGRAPGTDPVTSYALRYRQDGNGDDFLERLGELLAWDRGGFPDNHPFRRVAAMPSDVRLPPVYLLGSSDYSAKLAASLGIGFAFAHHFASHDAIAALRGYRQGVVEAGTGGPHAILAVAVVCAATDAEAEWHASSADFSAVRRERGEYLPLPSPDEAQAAMGAQDAGARERNRRRLFVGSPAKTRHALDPLIAATGADELMVVSAIHDHEARKRSYALLAEAYAESRSAAA